MLSVRTEESKQTEKKLRMRLAGRVSAVSQASTSSLVGELQAKVSQLESKLQQLSLPPPQASSKGSDSGSQNRKYRFVRNPKSSLFFCYCCGVEGHHMRDCKSPKNPTLVQEMLEKRSLLNVKHQGSSSKVDPKD